MTPPVVGRAPTEVEKRLIEAAGTVSIAASLDRIDVHAKYLLGLVTTFSALLSLGGLFSLGDFSLEGSAGWLALAFFPLAASLAFAVGSITPRPYLLDPADLNALAGHYRRLLRERGWMIALSGLLFALSLASVPLLVYLTTASRPQALPAVSNSSVSWIAGSEGVRTLVVELTLENVLVDSEMSWSVYSKASVDPLIVFSSILSAGPKVSSKIELPLPIEKEMQLRSEIVVTSAGKELHRERASFLVPAPQTDLEAR